jgi:TPP-dependent pyruvate/acetoin dehydrogenase alpha subunit
MYRSLAGSRRAEQAITDLSHRGVLPGHHSGLGHESIGVGIGIALRDDDCAQMSHRSAMMLAHARGSFSLRDAIAAKFGRGPGPFTRAPGRPRTIPIVGLVGTWVPMSVGIAMADRLSRKDSVTISFFGDGAANEGAVHEAMNLAGARCLPIVFVVENNGMAVSTPLSEATAAKELVSRAIGYGIHGVRVDGQDAVAVHEVAREAIARGRRGEGPTLIEAVIDRWEGHAVGIRELRTEQEVKKARAQDGVSVLRRSLIARGTLSEAEAADIDDECAKEILTAIEEFTRQSQPSPEPLPINDSDAQRLALAT